MQVPLLLPRVDVGEVRRPLLALGFQEVLGDVVAEGFEEVDFDLQIPHSTLAAGAGTAVCLTAGPGNAAVVTGTIAGSNGGRTVEMHFNI